MLPSQFSEEQKLKALTLKARILSGENIPLSELREFILSANSDLQKSREIREKPSKTDVDFF